MSAAPPSRQLLDPAGTLGAYPSTLSLTALAFVLAVVQVIVELVRGVEPVPLVAAFALFTAACAVIAAAADPTRAPFSARSHFLVHLFAVTAYILTALVVPASTGRFLADSWAAIGLGILTLAVGPYRPVGEMVAAGSISSAFVGFAAFARATATTPELPPLAVAAGTVLPILALCYGISTYSALTIRSLERSQLHADLAADALSDELREGIADDVQHGRASILENDVVPFLRRIVESGEITVEDRDRAVAISDAVRRIMVAEADRTWLTSLLDQTGAEVVDPLRLAIRLDPRQRTALRALVVAARDDSRASGLSIVFDPTPGGCTGTVSLRVDATEPRIRSTYSPFFAVMRVAFAEASLDFRPQFLTVRFRCDDRRRLDREVRL